MLRLVGCLSGTQQLMPKRIYGSGILLMQCCEMAACSQNPRVEGDTLPSNDAGALRPRGRVGASASFPSLQPTLLGPRQTVDLPSQDEKEDEHC